MKKKSRLTAQRIASSERIMQVFRSAPVIFNTRMADGIIGKCVIKQLCEMEGRL